MRVIYVDVDSLRADHTQPYGYERRITPNLQTLTRKSVVFDRYYCSDSPCLPSRTAFTCGQFGITNGVIGHFGPAARFRLEAGHGTDPDRPLLGQRLQQHGYYPAAVSMFAERHRAYFFLGNFRESIRASTELNNEEAHDVNRVALDWIRRHRDEDCWYLHITYWDPHTDYVIGPEWVERAALSGPAPRWPDDDAIRSHAEVYGPRSALDLHYSMSRWQPSPVPHSMPDAILNRSDFELLVNGYDAGVMYWDKHLGDLLETLEDLGIAGDTAVIVSADHGESLGENGSYAEHGLANEPTLRLPLVVYWPGVTERLPESARRCDAMLYNIDFAPTLCDLLDIHIPVGWHGISFASAIRGEETASRPYLALGQGAHTYQRAIRTADHLYIRTYHPGAFRAEWEQLFDVSHDRHLTCDLSAHQPQLVRQMRNQLMEWWNHYAGRPGALPDPMQTTLQRGPTYYNDPAKYAQHLRDTNRAQLAKDLEARLVTVSHGVPVSWHSPDAPGRFARSAGARLSATG
jgi:arylsulfatase A-like enzyme